MRCSSAVQLNYGSIRPAPECSFTDVKYEFRHPAVITPVDNIYYEQVLAKH